MLLALGRPAAGQAPAGPRPTNTDDANWEGLLGPGNGLSSYVHAVRQAPNGDIYVGGDFTNAGTSPNADYIARWNGSSWQPLGPGLTGSVYAIAVAPNGDLIVGGNFANAGGNPDADGIARWDGTSWHAIGNQLYGRVYAIKVLPNGDIIAGGILLDAATNSAGGLLRWDGSSWTRLGGGAKFNGDVYALATDANGDLLVGGAFSNVFGVAGATSIVRWTGSAWQALGGGLGAPGSSVRTIAREAGGTILAGGEVPGGLTRWNGTSWQTVAPGIFGRVSAVVVAPNGQLVVGGYFENAGGNPLCDYIGRWDGSTWQPMGSGLSIFGLSGYVFALDLTAGNDVIAGGAFTRTGDGSRTLGRAAIYRTRGLLTPSAAAWAREGWALYPSPAREQAVLLVPGGLRPGPVEATLHNALGQRVRRFGAGAVPAGGGRLPLDVTGLAPGCYVLRVQHQGRLLSHQLLVQ
ncbi:hypothetical protein [Hymenobacter edaphi]|uniref:Rax2-like C-terminal domain-containing protein n=1 Tax=Hymenobacter edaphi TaxID=2211146 RepID=A0A328BEL7_9BACT|nr:hypothetical protein [Hymenobacter edaphi]RAK65115.1 hypothetical protein DLM85_16365 [Hymenobacter edaphi]